MIAPWWMVNCLETIATIATVVAVVVMVMVVMVVVVVVVAATTTSVNSRAVASECFRHFLRGCTQIYADLRGVLRVDDKIAAGIRVNTFGGFARHKLAEWRVGDAAQFHERTGAKSKRNTSLMRSGRSRYVQQSAFNPSRKSAQEKSSALPDAVALIVLRGAIRAPPRKSAQDVVGMAACRCADRVARSNPRASACIRMHPRASV